MTIEALRAREGTPLLAISQLRRELERVSNFKLIDKLTPPYKLGHVGIGYFTKFDALRLNRDQVMTLETWLKRCTNVWNFATASPKTIIIIIIIIMIIIILLLLLLLLLLYFSVFLLNCKIRHASTTWKELIRKSLCLPIFRNITEIAKKK